MDLGRLTLGSRPWQRHDQRPLSLPICSRRPQPPWKIFICRQSTLERKPARSESCQPGAPGIPKAVRRSRCANIDDVLQRQAGGGKLTPESGGAGILMRAFCSGSGADAWRRPAQQNQNQDLNAASRKASFFL